MKKQQQTQRQGDFTNVAQIEDFEKIEQQLHSMLTEISELSKKKANDAVNKFKLNFVNVLLASANNILRDYKPFEMFSVFDEADVPTNSDVVIIMLSQYVASMFRMREANTFYVELDRKYHWLITGESGPRTEAPNHFKYVSR